MDPNALAGMVFTLLLAIVAGGFILLFPLSRRMGMLIEEKARAQKRPEGLSDRDIAELRDSLQRLEAELRLVSERQQFVEQLLDRREREAVPASAQASPRLPTGDTG